MCQIGLYATIMYEARAQEDYTNKMKEGLISGDLKKTCPQQSPRIKQTQTSQSG